MTSVLKSETTEKIAQPLIEIEKPEIPTSKPYKLVSRETHPESTIADTVECGRGDSTCRRNHVADSPLIMANNMMPT